MPLTSYSISYGVLVKPPFPSLLLYIVIKKKKNCISCTPKYRYIISNWVVVKGPSPPCSLYRDRKEKKTVQYCCVLRSACITRSTAEYCTGNQVLLLYDVWYHRIYSYNFSLISTTKKRHTNSYSFDRHPKKTKNTCFLCMMDSSRWSPPVREERSSRKCACVLSLASHVLPLVWMPVLTAVCALARELWSDFFFFS